MRVKSAKNSDRDSLNCLSNKQYTENAFKKTLIGDRNKSEVAICREYFYKSSYPVLKRDRTVQLEENIKTDRKNKFTNCNSTMLLNVENTPNVPNKHSLQRKMTPYSPMDFYTYKEKLAKCSTTPIGGTHRPEFLPAEDVGSQVSSRAVGLPEPRSRNSTTNHGLNRQPGSLLSGSVGSEISSGSTNQTEESSRVQRLLSRKRSVLSVEGAAGDNSFWNIGLHAAKRQSSLGREEPNPLPGSGRSEDNGGHVKTPVLPALVREKPIDLFKVIVWRESRRAKDEALCPAPDTKRMKICVPPMHFNFNFKGNDMINHSKSL